MHPLAIANRGQLQTLRQGRGQIFQTVNGNIDLAGEQAVIKLFREKAFAAGFGNQHVERLIAARVDFNQLGFNFRKAALQGGGHPIGLPQRQLAAARAEAQFHRVSIHGQTQKNDLGFSGCPHLPERQICASVESARG